MNNLDEAKKLLSAGDYTCVLVKDGVALTSKERGVKPLLSFIDGGKNFCGFAAADKIVGKAAALLYAYMKVSFVYAQVLSVSAQAVFEKYGIICECDTLTEKIINRKGDGVCPMELAVADTCDCKEGLQLIKAKLVQLNGN